MNETTHNAESAHPVYQHRDGSKCIWLDDTGWFVPLDAGGEGYDCRSPEHNAQRTEVLAEVATALERLRKTNPMNGDCSNHMLTQSLNAIASLAGDDRGTVIAAVQDVRTRRVAEEAARYQRLLEMSREEGAMSAEDEDEWMQIERGMRDDGDDHFSPGQQADTTKGDQK